MLIRLVISNFSSFDKEVEFNMLTASPQNLRHHVYHADEAKVLKAAAIYGANGAGKSNLIDAFRHLQQWVTAGVIQNSVDKLKFRLNSSNAQLPIFFEIEFFAAGMFFVYGIHLDDQHVIKEYLCESGMKQTDKLIFKRSIDEMQKISVAFPDKNDTLKEKLESGLLKNNELLLCHSIVAIPKVQAARDWLVNDLILMRPTTGQKELLLKLCTSDKFLQFSNQLTKTLDTGLSYIAVDKFDYNQLLSQNETLLFPVHQIEEHRIVPTDQGKYFTTKENGKIIFNRILAFHHRMENNPIAFDLAEESDGTQRLLEFFPIFATMLERDVTIIIDEIDQSIHPVLLKSLIKKIMAHKETLGQLIFTTHESNLLDLKIFREDEIWFAEKDKKTGATEYYPLSDFNYSDELDLKTGYLNGRFGAIPFLANLKYLNW
ncbi:AAA family ATPase [Chitinophaga silvisoli]|uniref:ATPase AAA-type core domain-containing protein n=1 Tax=Chitinophaga silvisoli TaxID=2291814 RepID=A0A3E1P9R8_9BACT|nr:ATP-binding protein [Chitinophaga silvisoli]RFM36904.1 hypothetical protein DXN04_05250 [Chitinophaga silvisoli]